MIVAAAHRIWSVWCRALKCLIHYGLIKGFSEVFRPIAIYYLLVLSYFFVASKQFLYYSCARAAANMGSPIAILTPACWQRHFVAYEWQCTGLDNRGRQFFIQDFWDNLVGKLCSRFNWKITLGCLLLSVRMSFAKKTDDRVVYFLNINYTCWNSI